jgi:ethanolamine ammonia-lyase small subunit
VCKDKYDQVANRLRLSTPKYVGHCVAGQSLNTDTALSFEYIPAECDETAHFQFRRSQGHVFSDSGTAQE